MVVQYFPKSKSPKDQEQHKNILGVHVITKTLQIAPVFALAFFPLARVFKFKPKFNRVVFGSTILSGVLCTGGLIKSFSESKELELQDKAWKL